MGQVGRAVPPRVVAAERAASAKGFTKSCLPEVGRLLALAVAAKPGGVVAESGTGAGVGTAWLHSGLGPGARLFTVERDEELARRVAGDYADDERVSVLTGDWRLLERHAPFDVFVCSGSASNSMPPHTGRSDQYGPATPRNTPTRPARPASTTSAPTFGHGLAFCLMSHLRANVLNCIGAPRSCTLS